MAEQGLQQGPQAPQAPGARQGPKVSTRGWARGEFVIKAKSVRKNKGQPEAKGGGASLRDLGANSSDCPST